MNPGLPTSLEYTLSIILGYDADTLREQVDLKAVGERLAEIGDMRSLSALCEKAWLLKVAGQLDEALDLANQCVRLARFTGDRKGLMQPRMLRAQVLQFRGAYDEALHELSSLINEAHTHEWSMLEALALQHRGKVYFDQREYKLALADFKASIRLRTDLGASDEELESSTLAVKVTESFLGR